MLTLHLMTADPSHTVSLPPGQTAPIQMSGADLAQLALLLPGQAGHGCHGPRVTFNVPLPGGTGNDPIIFRSGTQDWFPVTYWFLLDDSSRGSFCLGHGPLHTPLTVTAGMSAAMAAGSLIRDHRTGTVQANVILPCLSLVPPLLGGQQQHQAAPPLNWISPPRSGCECGAEKTWGPKAGGHSSWCPKAAP